MIVDETIFNISKYYHTVFVDKYIIMPNHIHMILFLYQNEAEHNKSAPAISLVVNQMKGYITKKAVFPLWQKSFHDHIIRNEEKYKEIWKYIDNNPLKWELDKYYVSK